MGDARPSEQSQARPLRTRLRDLLSVTLSLLVSLAVVAPLLRSGERIHVDAYRVFDWLEAAKHRWFARHSLLEEQVLPLWNPYLEGGIPSFAHPGDGTLSLLTLPELAFGVLFGMKASVAMMLLLGTAGVWALARRWLDLPPSLACFSASLFAVSGWTASRIAVGFYESLSLMVFPLALLCLLESTRAATFRRCAAWAGFGGLLLLSVAMSAQLCLLFLFLHLGLWCTVRLAAHPNDWPRLLIGLAIPVVLVGLGGSVKWLPMLDFIGDRSWRVEDVGVEVGATDGIADLARGFTRTLQPTGERDDNGVPLENEYSPAGFPELALPLLLLALLGRRQREKGLSLAVLLVVTLGLGFDDGKGAQWSLFSLLHSLPLFEAVRGTARYQSFFLLLWASLAAGLGALALLRFGHGLLPQRKSAATAAILAVLASFVLLPQAMTSRALFEDTFTESLPDGPPLAFGSLEHLCIRADPASNRLRRSTIIFRNLRAGRGNIYRAEDLPDHEILQLDCTTAMLPNDNLVTEEIEAKPARLVAGTGDFKRLLVQGNRAQLQLETTTPSQWLLNMRYHPGWTAPEGVQLTERERRLLVELKDPTSGEVQLEFRPPGLRMGGWLSSLGLILGLGLILWGATSASPSRRRPLS